MSVKITDSESLSRFFKRELGTFASEDFRGIAMYRDGEDELTMAVAYNNFIGRTCCMHVVVKRSMTREMIKTSFDYPFNQCGVNTVFVQIDSVNTRSITFCKKIGFQQIYEARDGGLDGHLVIMKLDKADCSWIRSRNGQEISTTPA